MSLQFHSLCVPVEGFLRTAIYDLQFGSFYLASNQVQKELKEKQAGMDGEWASLGNVLMAKPVKRILPIKAPEFDYPSVISNAIAEIDAATDVEKLVGLLEQAFCYNLQLAANVPGLDETAIRNLASVIHRSIVKHCELVLHYEDFVRAREALKRTTFPELAFVCVYQAPKNELNPAGAEYPAILFSSDGFSWQTGKDVKHLDLFKINPLLYAESLHFNTYYNRKMFIDKEGLIRNGPLSDKSFGNIYKDHSWARLLRKREFKQLWEVRKDSISVCKVCEFRHMCTDAREPVRHKGKEDWYMDTECNYNPYLAKWRGEPGYAPLAESGVTVDPNGLTIDQDALFEKLQALYPPTE